MNVLELTQLAEVEDRTAKQKQEDLNQALFRICRDDISVVIAQITDGLPCEYGASEWHTRSRGVRLAYVYIRLVIPGFIPFWAVAEAENYLSGHWEIIPPNDRRANVILIDADPTSKTWSSCERVEFSRADAQSRAEFFKKLKDAHLKSQAKLEADAAAQAEAERQRQIGQLSKGFVKHFTTEEFYQSIEEAQAALEELIALKPAAKVVYQADYDRWLENFQGQYLPWLAEQEARDAEEARRRAEVEADKARFREEFIKVEKWRRMLKDNNLARLGALREYFETVTLDVYDIEYAAVANYEDEVLVDRETRMCLAPAPQADSGYHQVLERRSVKPYRYANVVRVSAPYRVTVGAINGAAGRLQLLPYTGVYDWLYFNPTLDPAQVESRVNSILAKLPADPDLGKLSLEEYYQIQRQALVEEFGEEPEVEPY